MSYSPAMQKAAVKAALAEGSNLADIRKKYPELKEGVELVEKETTEPPRRRGSGSAAPMTSRRPRGL